jgi:GNAT superfamily N-acetyltransferase
MIEIITVDLNIEGYECYWYWFENIVEMSIKNKFYEKELSLMLMFKIPLPYTIYVVLRDSKMIAYALVDKGKDQAMIAFMLVDSPHQHRGLGKKIMNVIIRSTPDVDIYTETNDKISLEFYNKCDFKLDKTKTKKGDKFLTLKLNR